MRPSSTLGRPWLPFRLLVKAALRSPLLPFWLVVALLPFGAPLPNSVPCCACSASSCCSCASRRRLRRACRRARCCCGCWRAYVGGGAALRRRCDRAGQELGHRGRPAALCPAGAVCVFCDPSRAAAARAVCRGGRGAGAVGAGRLGAGADRLEPGRSRRGRSAFRESSARTISSSGRPWRCCRRLRCGPPAGAGACPACCLRSCCCWRRCCWLAHARPGSATRWWLLAFAWREAGSGQRFALIAYRVACVAGAGRRGRLADLAAVPCSACSARWLALHGTASGR